MIVTAPLPGAPRTGQVLLVSDPDHPDALRLHRVVRVDHRGITLQGDANGRPDSDIVARAAVRGVGVLRIPLIGLPRYWLGTGDWPALGLGLASCLFVAALASPRRAAPETRLAGPSAEVTPSAERMRPVRIRRGLRPPRRARSRRPVVAAACVTAALFVGTMGTSPADATYLAGTSSGGSTLGSRSCYTKPVQDDPTFHYSFNETSGASADDGSVHGNDGLVQGTVTRSNDPCDAAHAASYVHYDGAQTDGGGTTSMVSTSLNLPAPNTFTIETWFRGAYGPMIGFADGRTYPFQITYDRMLYITDGLVRSGVYNGAANILSSPLRYDDNAWHMAQGVLSSSGMELSVDGLLVATDPTVTSGQTYSGWWRIGQMSMGGWGSG